jgi:hypothetical protein
MPHIRLSAVALLAFASALVGVPTNANAQRTYFCVVADTSGTPLNVRSSPNGRVVSTVRNGVEVEISDEAVDRRGRLWVYIGYGSGDAYVQGWVIRRFLRCS